MRLDTCKYINRIVLSYQTSSQIREQPDEDPWIQTRMEQIFPSVSKHRFLDAFQCQSGKDVKAIDYPFVPHI